MQELFQKNCPMCGIAMSYRNQRGLQLAIKRNSKCSQCVWTKERKEACSEKCKGEKNGFYGKKHTQKTIDIIKNHDVSWMQTEEYKSVVRKQCTGSGNPMYGKNVYDTWLKKYGKEEADKRQDIMRKKKSEQSRGSNNPMYGKPAPKGSGGGWSGWYKEWYFRSLRELTYMIDVIEKNNYSWRTGERDLEIKYIGENGQDRIYRADFLVEEKRMVEIKPEKLMFLQSNVLKKQAAELFCKEKGYEYNMVDIKIMNFDRIVELYKNGTIKFIGKYEQKIKELICKLEKKEN